MGHVLFRLRQLHAAVPGTSAGTRLLLISAVAGLAFLAYSGAAQASTCQTNCSDTPIPAESAQISQTPTTSQTQWSGMPYAFGNTSNPTDCGRAEPSNGLCDHYELTPQDPGPVQVTLTWIDPVNTFNLLVCLVPPLSSLQMSTDFCSGPTGLDGTVVAKDMNSSNSNFDTLTFTPVPGTTYEIRAIPFSVFPTALAPAGETYQGCAGYTSFGGCAPPSTSGGTPITTTNSCPATIPSQDMLSVESATTADRRNSGSGDVATKEHFSFHAEQETSHGDDPVEGQVSYKNDGVVQFKSRKITCVSFFDEGYDSQGDPKGSTEIRGEGTLKFDDGTKKLHECFRAFARDNGDHPSGSDQFDITFADPAPDGSCNFTEPPTGRTLTKGNVEYRLDA